MAASTILIVEDERIIAEDLKKRLEDLDYEISNIVNSGTKAITAAERDKPDLILMDIILKGGMDGIEAAKIIHTTNQIPVVYLTAYSDDEILDRAGKTGSSGYLVKPFRDRELHATIKMALAKHALEGEVKEARDWFYSTLKCIGDGVIVTDQNGIVTFLNTVATELTGWKLEDACGRPIDEVFHLDRIVLLENNHPDGVQGFFSALKEKQIAEYAIPTSNGETKYLCGSLLNRDNTLLEIENSVAAVHTSQGDRAGSVVVFRDITAQKKAEQEKLQLQHQLRHAQKVEAIGTMAGGIAHDFNNILSAILGYADLAKMTLAEPAHTRDNINQVIKAGHRARDLIRQILSFSRMANTVSGHAPLDIGPIIREVVTFQRSVIPATIKIITDIDPDCGLINADPTQIHQVVMNLCTNAAQEMEEQGGTLKVVLAQTELGAEDLPAEGGFASGVYCKLSVIDTGSGLTQELIDKIFDPYFTTKEVGKGSGMGLSVVQGIVKAHGSFIKVESKLEKGTSFDVFFPLVEAAADEKKSKTDPQVVPTGTERILFVDDESMLVNVGKAMLERIGYTVTAQTDSRAALRLFKDDPARFDLVITDQAMPYLSGVELAGQFLLLRPDLPIILCTGFSASVNERQAKRIGIKEYALKPVRFDTLAGLVRKVLDGS